MPHIKVACGNPQVISSFSGAYEFLSNFYPCEIEYEGFKFQTTEAAFQAAKTDNKKDKTLISQAATPGIAKRLGRRVPLRSDWEERKFWTMYEILRQKFARGTEMAKRLEETGTAVLVEGTKWHDQYWGICTCPKCGGKGRNFLGQILMKIRDDNRYVVPYKLDEKLRSDWATGGPYNLTNPE